jgi:hypothetical protein
MEGACMKKLAILCLMALELALGGCAIPPPTTQVNTTASGNWEAQLSGGTGEGALMNFTTTFQFANLGAVDITYLNFLTSNACFQGGQTATATITCPNNACTLPNGQFSGVFTYKIVSGIPAGNALTLKGTITGTSSGTAGTIGTLTNGAVTGTPGPPNSKTHDYGWKLTGSSDCGGKNGMTGTFTMCQGSATCAPIL